jgi:hypothetical protein
MGRRCVASLSAIEWVVAELAACDLNVQQAGATAGAYSKTDLIHILGSARTSVLQTPSPNKGLILNVLAKICAN